ncbi:MAG: hypothetical protein M9894_27145 [Planctomycetes bacterium]|nr:hypothetical protein [Planctomycetota bacterium]
MRRSSSWRLVVVVALGALALAPGGGAQEAPPAPELAPWAPKWRKGDWWVVKTYQRDLKDEVSSPEPAEGAMPRTPPDPRREPIPGLPPLRDGVPEGWVHANTFRFEVVRRELVRYPDDGPDDKPEPFLVVAVRTLEGATPRTAELWYTEADLTLFKVVREPKTERARTHEVAGTVQLDPPESGVIGFPLDWPDFVAAKQPSSDVAVEGRGVVEQKVRPAPNGANQVQVRLGLKVGDEETRGRVQLTFEPGAPFWVRLVGPVYLAELVDYKGKRK